MNVPVPFVAIGRQYEEFREEILSAFDNISRSGIHVLGTYLERFEEQFAAYCETKYSIGVGNGSDALSYCLLAHDIGPGDEVITAPNSFVASAWTIANVGAKIVFADVREDFNIDPIKLEAAITSRTKAVMPVHLTGQIADMEAILDIADRYNLIVIEDAAQAVGAKQNGKRAGSFGHAGCFSLHPLKNLHVHGDGGVITTNDADVARKIKVIRNHGLVNRDECLLWGYNSRLDEIQAAIASIKLPHLDRLNQKHMNIAKIYHEALGECVSVPITHAGNQSVFHRYIIRSNDRDRLAAELATQGIQTKINYPIPLHLQKAAGDLGYSRGDFPVAEEQALQILSLPMHPYLSDEEVKAVIEGVKSVTTNK